MTAARRSKRLSSGLVEHGRLAVLELAATLRDEEMEMFLAMNRFKVLAGSEDAFEEVWRNRRSRLDEMPGFVSFALMRGPQGEEYTLFASHTIWKDEAAFRAWTTSEQFRATHRNAGENKPLYAGHPEFEGFTRVEGV